MAAGDGAAGQSTSVDLGDVSVEYAVKVTYNATTG
jgi:hypothetical protein